MPTVCFRVCGSRPAPWADGLLTGAWRGIVAGAASQYLPLVDGVGANTTFSVSIDFFIAVGRNVDLDNLAKPVIDTLFNCPDPRHGDGNPTGVLFNVDDVNVVRLVLQKRNVRSEREEGITVVIDW